MATLECCGGKRSANSYRLASSHTSFTFQRFYPLKKPCPTCGIRKMQWRGEAPDGALSPFFDIDPGAHAQWLRRAETEEARPEAQLMSEYSQKMAGPIDSQIRYNTKLCQAHRIYKGVRV